MTQIVPQTTRVLLAMAAGSLVFLAASVGTASAAHEAAQQPTAGCWKQVINDWDDNGRVDHVYAPPCYTQAIQHLNSYPDIKGYSSAIDDIQAALYAVLHEEGHGGGGGGSGGSGGGGSSAGPPATGGGAPATSDSINGLAKKHNSGPFAWLTDRLAPGNAQSVPLPLVVLGALALLLLLAALGTWLARRVQSNRMKPAPAPAPRRSP